MKSREDLARGWWRKGENDLANARLCVAANQALDTACFHAQQATEKYLKAYMAFNGIEFPFIHNLEKLVALCSIHAQDFSLIKETAQALTPFAVEARYDDEFWPDIDTTREAINIAEHIRQFIFQKLPKSFQD